MKTSKIYKLSSEEFYSVVKNSLSYSEIARKCQLKDRGSNFNTIRKRIKNENIECSHLRGGLDANRGRIFLNRRISKEDAINKYFIKGMPQGLRRIPVRLVKILVLRYNFIEFKCSKCNIGNKWCDEFLNLQLDHINGDYTNNELNNLRFLCPNCHSQTNTWGGKNIKQNKKEWKCKFCGKKTSKKYTRCISCANKKLL